MSKGYPIACVAMALSFAVTACEGERHPTTPRAVVARMASAPLAPALRDAIGGLQEKRGPEIARLDFSDARALRHWKLSVKGGELVEVPQEGYARIEPAGAPLTWLRARPPVPLPPSFRVEIRLKTRVPGGLLPALLLWETDLFPRFNARRHGSRQILDADPHGATRAAYEVLQWSGPVERIRFNFMDLREPLEIAEIVIYAPPARNLSIADDGVLWGVLDSRAKPTLFAPLPSRHDFRTTIPEDGLLRVSLGVATSATSGRLRFRIYAADEARPRMEEIRKACPSCGQWFPVEADLADLAGREVELRFEVAALDTEKLSGDSEPAAVALWGAPMLLGRKVLGRKVMGHKPIDRIGDAPPVVILVTWDTARQRQLSLYGNAAPNTPFANELAASGAVFDRAFSQAPWTIPSMASMLTSQPPWQLDVVWGHSHRIPAKTTTLAEAFAESGFVTGGFVANFVLALDGGYAQGFDTYEVSRHQMRDGADVSAAALAWAETHRGEALFLFVHYVDPHDPYRADREAHDRLFPHLDFERYTEASYPPDDEREAEILLRRYEAEILRSDHQLRRLVEGIRSTTGNEVIVALTSDHGEEFLEHGFHGHGGNLFETQTQVPLLFHGPGVPTARVTAPVRNLDVMPTLLELAGVEPQATIAGTSLLPLMEGKSLPLVAYSETNSHGPRRASVRDDRFTYMTFESYDPLSTRPAGTDPEIERQVAENLPARALYDHSGKELDASAHPEVVRRLQRVIDDVELRRHDGIGVRLRGPRTGEGAITIRGRIWLRGGRISSARTRLAEQGEDHFEVSRDRSALSFRVTLKRNDEDWVLLSPSGPRAQATLELEAESAAGLVTLLGVHEVAAEGPIPIRATSSSPETLMQAFEAAEGQGVAQIWRSDEPHGGSSEGPSEEEISRLRALGYMK